MTIPQEFINEIESYNCPTLTGLVEALAETEPETSIRSNLGKNIGVPEGVERVPWCNMRSRMIMQVHDELVFNVKPEELDTLRQLVTRNMENAYHGRVPLLAASGVGKNWLEAH